MPLLDLFWAMLWFFLFVAWLWLLIAIVGDIFRSDDMSGWAKALWVLLIIVLPLLGSLGYLITRGRSMHERSLREMATREEMTHEYIRSVATGGPSTADELSKLAGLHRSGVIDDHEFATQKAKLLTAG